MLGAHVIFGAYGFWLPNDPRGSWSTFVGSYELYRYGRATKTTERRSLAYDSHDRELRLAAKSALQRPAISFNDAQIEAIAAGIGEYVWKSRTHVWALAILRDHVHAVIAASTVNVKQRVNLIKGAATRELILCGIHPFQDLADDDGIPKCFAQGEWKVFLDQLHDIDRSVRYVEANPEKEGPPPQRWPFVRDWREDVKHVVPVREED
jgi:REP element-mobilizing transposase RayT